jgi:hypothetical protein
VQRNLGVEQTAAIYNGTLSTVAYERIGAGDRQGWRKCRDCRSNIAAVPSAL